MRSVPANETGASKVGAYDVDHPVVAAVPAGATTHD